MRKMPLPAAHIRELDDLEYVDATDSNQIKVDCSFGVNPFGYTSTLDPASLAKGVDFSNYPPFPYTELQEKLAEFWDDSAGSKLVELNP